MISSSDFFPFTYIVTIIVSLICFAITLCYPIIGGLCFIASYWILTWTVCFDKSLYMFACLLFGWCVLFLYLGLWMAIAIWVIDVGLECLYSMATGGTAKDILIPITCNALAACVGIIWWLMRDRACRREREQELLRAAERTANLHRDIGIASRLHDSLTNDLSYIIMMTDILSRDSDATSPHRSELESVHERAQEAFIHAHEVIGVLKGERSPSVRNEVGAIPVLESTLKGIRSELQNFGFRGTFHIDLLDRKLGVDDEILSEIVSLLGELSANIRKHCNPDQDSYEFRIGQGAGRISIMQMNTVSALPEKSSISSGQGLRMHGVLIELLDGTMQCSMEDGVWIAAVTLPLTVSASMGMSHEA
jgi:signal transduction histidine kinase